MSTPSVKPIRPTERSLREVPRDAERSVAEPHHVEDSALSPYAPKAGRGGMVVEPVATGDDGPPPPRFLLSSRHGSGRDRGLTDFSDSALQLPDKHPEETYPQEYLAGEGEGRHTPPPMGGPAVAARLAGSDNHQTAPAHGRDRAAAGRREEMLDNDELKRLEDSVRQLQREAAATRPRVSLTPVGHADDARAPRRRTEAFVDGYRVPPSLQPEILPPPPRLKASRGRLQTVMSMVVASVVAAPIAYYFAASATDPMPAEGPDTVLAGTTLPSAEPQATASVPMRAENIWTPGSQGGQPDTSFDRPRASQAPSQIAAAPTREVAPPAETPAPPVNVERAPPVVSVERTPPPPAARVERPPPPALRVLDPAAIEVLVSQGQKFIAAGDFVTARLVFQRAAEAGSAVAAMALGATYDPVVLAGRGAHSVEADVSKARIWYQKAKEFGAPDAERRLNVLANR